MPNIYLKSCVVLIAVQLHLVEPAACQIKQFRSLTWMQSKLRVLDETKTTPQAIRSFEVTACTSLWVLLVEVQSLCEPF